MLGAAMRLKKYLRASLALAAECSGTDRRAPRDLSPQLRRRVRVPRGSCCREQARGVFKPPALGLRRVGASLPPRRVLAGLTRTHREPAPGAAYPELLLVWANSFARAARLNGRGGVQDIIGEDAQGLADDLHGAGCKGGGVVLMGSEGWRPTWFPLRGPASTPGFVLTTAPCPPLGAAPAWSSSRRQRRRRSTATQLAPWTPRALLTQYEDWFKPRWLRAEGFVRDGSAGADVLVAQLVAEKASEWVVGGS